MKLTKRKFSKYTLLYIDGYFNGKREKRNTGIRLVGNKLHDNKAMQDAKDLLRELEKNEAMGLTTFTDSKQVIKDSILKYIRTKDTENTKKSIKYSLKHLKQDITLGELRQSHIDQYFINIKDLQYKSRIVYKKHLRGFLKWANTMVFKMPLIKKPITKEIEVSTFWTLDELRTAINNLPQQSNSLYWFAVGWCFSSLCCGLRFSDLHQVTYEMLRDGKIKIKPQKSIRADTVVDIPLNITIVKKIIPVDLWEDNDVFVFRHMKYKPRLREYLTKWASSFGVIKDTSFHQSRKNFGAILLNSDAKPSISVVAKFLGNSTAICEKTYTELLDKQSEKIVDSINI